MQKPFPGSKRVYELIERGVVIPCPESVEVDYDFPPEQIAPGVVIHAGSKILGAKTSIGPQCEIGSEAPATLENCQLGKGVSLKGGYFSGATFLDGSNMGSGAHVRSGTLLEEEANGAHTVGFKQTIFLPFVTAGSLINLCDCLMAGGTSRKNHSEIGSSYIHFNFTPHQDKATASLIGDVPRGVMLDQPPIFLGGQGGLVGPARIDFGTVIPAGVVCRQDVLVRNQFFLPSSIVSVKLQKYDQGLYRSINRIITNNLVYIANIQALKTWYLRARKRLMSGNEFAKACWAGALGQLEMGIEERIKRLGELAGKMPRSLEIAQADEYFPQDIRFQQQAFYERWPEIERKLKEGPADNIAVAEQDIFFAEWNKLNKDTPYPEAVGKLSAKARVAGTAWLQAIVDSVAAVGDEYRRSLEQGARSKKS